jgi:hypothetical protein
MGCCDVALWLSPPGMRLYPEYTEEVEAAFPLDAVATLMKKHNLLRVCYAAVGLGDGSGIVRFKRGVRIIPIQELEQERGGV